MTEREDPRAITRSLRDRAGGQVTVRLGPQMTYELRADGELLALIEPPGFPAGWRARAMEGDWRLALEGRRGWRLAAAETASRRPAARFERTGLRAGGRVDTVSDSRSYSLRRTRPWGRSWRIAERGGDELLEALSEPRRDGRMRLSLRPAAALDPQLALIVFVSFSAIFLEEAMGAAGDGGPVVG